MRQWLVLIISICIVIFSGIYEISYLKSSNSYILADIEYCRNAVENNNFKLAKEHVKEVYDTWNYIKTGWGIFIDHEEIGNIEEKILDFNLSIKNENKEEAILASRQLERILLHAADKQKLSVENIF